MKFQPMDSSAADLHFLRSLPPAFLDRYNRPGPRYTSYPTVPEWRDTVTGREVFDRLREDAAARPRDPLSLYLHIPFCQARCLFCGCNAIATPRREVAIGYLENLRREMSLVAAACGGRPVVQVHVGGGTPTYLAPADFGELFAAVRVRFAVAADAEISFEADPCVTTEDHLSAARRAGATRVSFGVQDFHPATQKAIGRIQPEDMTRRVVGVARRLGYAGVNLDLVYGLPFQTDLTFARTLDAVIALAPDRVALYNFAYLPARMPHQKAMDPASLPGGSEKFRIFAGACERFLGAGYVYVGMDHFARPDDDLARALAAGTLRRNFMGYTTHAGTDLLAFGVTGISLLEDLYVQSARKLSVWGGALADGALAVERAKRLSPEDRLRRDVIHAFLCQRRVDTVAIGAKYRIDFDRHFAAELAALAPLEDDGLVRQEPGGVALTILGAVFSRNVAMVFDAYLTRTGRAGAYSKTL
ncbi:MAG: oxygen-independent coproporphyrinogen III oxidase [Planctomycetota bacterium]